MSRMYFTKFTVTGRGRFPVDMLRYDECFPRTGEDAQAMNYDSESLAGVREVRSVTLCTYARHGSRPTAARWASFGWSVNMATVETERLAP
ncbi:hypothetical protein UFOVP119_64 [uncultured Caudovirales phage]|uniref:Uncharacterized protein n=1 Tax=uncultured Caudovirales phage TaxID=2100421 RepID=A0A6J5LBY2_9CAUD|nr:hypothetical protein UFOVP119_64 [uncultured Caudovirales phage]